MPKTKETKKQDLEILENKLNDSKSVIFANFFGLKVKDTEALRTKCRENNLSCSVLKKNLLTLALKNKGVQVEDIEGEIVAIFGDDEVIPAKITADFGKAHKSLKIVAGVIDGKFSTKEDVITLSKLPSREELLAKFVGTINAPVSGFVNVLAGNMRKFVYVLDAIKNVKN